MLSLQVMQEDRT